MTKSRWGMITVDMHVGSASRSLNYCKYPCRSAFYFICLVSSLKSNGDEHACNFFKNWSLKYKLNYLNYLGRCLESWVLPAVVVVVLETGPLAVVPVGFCTPLIYNKNYNL